MARPRKEEASTYRVPTFVKSDNRWRLRIDHAHGTKEFRWPNNGTGTTCPPQIQAAAVTVQDHWRSICADWSNISFVMSHADPTKDWSRPAWVTAEQVAAAKSAVEETRNTNRQVHQVQTAYSAAAIGIDTLADTLARLTPGAPSNPGGPWEHDRVALLQHLRPAIHRKAVTTTRSAMTAYLSAQKERTKLKAGDWIDPKTFRSIRCNLLGAFGLSTSGEQQQYREVKINKVKFDLDAPLPDRNTMEAFCRYWHMMPEGIDSSRTVKNYLNAARTFFRWCEDRYAFDLPNDIAKLMTAANVETPAEQWNPERLKKILAQGKKRGGERLKMYLLFGLLNGYGQTDCAEISIRDYLKEGSEHFIHRFRSKEDRPKRGSRPIRIKHWIAPELAVMIGRNRGKNPQGYLFNGERGTVLTDRAVTGMWERAVEDADDTLTFKQLRKMGYNRIKNHAGSREVAELWDGHSGGIADHYDDGIFLPVIDAQKKFAAELWAEGVLS